MNGILRAARAALTGGIGVVIVLATAVGCGPSTAPPVTQSASPTASPVATLAPTTPAPDPCDPRIALTPTPLPADILNGPSFDPDIFPPLDVMHNPPAVLRPDEKVLLEFQLTCGITDEPVSCQAEATLYAGWGDGPLRPIEMQLDDYSVRAAVPAADENGRPLRYYAEARDPHHNVGVRFPTVGCFAPLVVETPIEVRPPDPQPVEAEVALSLPWGQAEGQVGVDPAAMIPDGPNAFDVGPDGTIVVLDNVNSRVIVARPGGSRPSSFPITGVGYGDIAFDRSWQIAVLDTYGDPLPYGVIGVPRVILYQFDGTLVAEAPVFARLPNGFAGSRAIQDGSDQQWVTPFDDQGRALSRDEQRAARTAPELRAEFIDETHFYLADAPDGLAFNLSAGEELGALHLFERAADGYLAVFQDLGVFRILRFDAGGEVSSYVEVEAAGIEWGSLGGFTASGQDGAVYIMTTARETVEILRVSPPGI